MQKLITFVTIIIVTAIFILTSTENKAKSQKKLTIKNKVTINYLLAKTEAEKEKGLSNHQPLADKTGMLFVYEQSGLYPFWMKDMLFDLDFIFIQDDRIVDLQENIQAPINNSGKIVFVNSKKPFNKVLEINSGLIKKWDLQVNDFISFD